MKRFIVEIMDCFKVLKSVLEWLFILFLILISSPLWLPIWIPTRLWRWFKAKAEAIQQEEWNNKDDL